MALTHSTKGTSRIFGFCLPYRQDWLFETCLDQALDGDSGVKVLRGALQALLHRPGCPCPSRASKHCPQSVSGHGTGGRPKPGQKPSRTCGFLLCTAAGRSYGALRRSWRSGLLSHRAAHGEKGKRCLQEHRV